MASARPRTTSLGLSGLEAARSNGLYNLRSFGLRFKKQYRWAIQKGVDTWWPETLTTAMSVICSLSIGIILQCYDSRENPDFSSGITLNAIISILATISKSAMLFVVTSCLGQMKWIAFQERRTLSQLQLLEDASKGPLGACWLLLDRLSGSLAGIGAVITILALAFDPFVQQVLGSRTTQVKTPSSAAAIKQSRGFFYENGFIDGAHFTQAVSKGIWSDEFDQQATCPSGNCEWGPHRSIGWCHRCQQVSTRIDPRCDLSLISDDFEKLEQNVTLRKPCALQVDGISNITFNMTLVKSAFGDQPGENVETTAKKTYVLMSAPTRIVAMPERTWNYSKERYQGGRLSSSNIYSLPFSIVFTDLQYNDDYRPYTNSSEVCTLDICERGFNVTVTDGIKSVQPQDISFGINFSRNLTSDILSPNSTLLGCYNGSIPRNYSRLADKDICSGKDINLLCWGHRNKTNLLLNDRWTLNPTPGAKPTDPTLDYYAFVFFDEESLTYCNRDDGALGQQHNSMGTDMARILNGSTSGIAVNECQRNATCKLASATTRTMVVMHSSEVMKRLLDIKPDDLVRNIADSLTKLALDTSWTNITGNVASGVQLVEVRWYWLILPASLNIASAVLLVLTIQQTRYLGAPLWRSSIIALLFHGLADDVAVPHTSAKVSEMDSHAEKTHVQLRLSEKTGGLILANASCHLHISHPILPVDGNTGMSLPISRRTTTAVSPLSVSGPDSMDRPNPLR